MTCNTHVNSPLRPQSVIFGGFDNFLHIFSGKRVWNFFGAKFFSRKFDPKQFLFELPNSFWPIMHLCLVMLKMPFSVFSNIDWDLTQNPPIETFWKMYSPNYTLKNIKIYKRQSLGSLKIKLDSYYGGGVHGNYIWLLDY